MMLYGVSSHYEFSFSCVRWKTHLSKLFICLFSHFFECRDGLHLSEGGNRIVFEEVIKKLKDAGLSLETLPVDLPHIAEIDPNDPLKAFQI